VHNMCLMRPVLLFLNMPVLKMLYEQIKWMDNQNSKNLYLIATFRWPMANFARHVVT